MAEKIVAPSYKRLVTDIVCLFEGARKTLAEAYWKTGQRIVEIEQDGAVKAAYGTGLLLRLSEDLTAQCGPGFSDSNLRRMRQFYLAYPKRAAPHELTWAQYSELLPVGNAAVRERLEKRALREGLTHKAIRELVRHEAVREEVAEKLSFRHARGDLMSPSSQAHNLAARDSGPGTPRTGDESRGTSPEEQVPLLTPVRGTLNTYRVFHPKLVEAATELLIDLGFSCYRSVQDLKILTDSTCATRHKRKDLADITGKRFAPETLVTSAKTNEGYTLSTARSALSDLYTYAAQVEKIVDGDTLRVVVDLGFGIKTRQYLRLRGLDCPEINTPEGKKAAEFVKARIRTASRITLTSSRSDKYDRYLADVHFIDLEGQEIYLNNLLLQQGLAVRMGE